MGEKKAEVLIKDLIILMSVMITKRQPALTLMGKLKFHLRDLMSEIIVKIKINNEFKEFKYSGELNIPVTTLLDDIGEITYSCSCLQGLCGACAMVINSQPRLACQTIVGEEQITQEYGIITIEPLSKFPLIKDLKVDKTKLYEDLKESGQWLESDAQINSDNIDFEYEMSLCLMCGCCVEACPNYDGKDFVGAPIAVSSSKIISQESNSAHLKELKDKYRDRFYSHCVKSIACEDVCPMGIETQRAISKMNKKAVWKLWRIFERD